MRKIWFRLAACFLALASFTFLFNQAVAGAGQSKVGESKPEVKLTDIEAGGPTLTVDSKNDKPHSLHTCSNCLITINGALAKVQDLKPGDEIKALIEKDGLVSVLKAERAETGIILGRTADATNSDKPSQGLFITSDFVAKRPLKISDQTKVSLNGQIANLQALKQGDKVKIYEDDQGKILNIAVERKTFITHFLENVKKNLFKPILLFFYLGFSIPLLKVAFEFPKSIYQGLTIYLLISIGWHGGEELADLSGNTLKQALNFLTLGFCTNTLIGFLAYFILRNLVPKMRKIDAATVSAYYGSDSAGTFVTALGVLQSLKIAYAAYMPVMLAVMEIPGCLVGLYLVSKLRNKGMDANGNMPGEKDYDQTKVNKTDKKSAIEIAREVVLNPGLFLLFGGILTGYLGRLQGYSVVEANDKLFVSLFQGMLCLFLLEMGMTAASRLKDLKQASFPFIAFGLIAPNLFAILGISVAILFSRFSHEPLQLGTYVLFAVLCAAASYIAVPAIQRLAIPEASPTLPLASSLGLTFSYNVTLGIPLYLMITESLLTIFPI
ncbi:MAG: sodium-dependent bicarbonate transport family permease [Candidatus Obscuribacterales bacterium]|nr:sodium-dependent bicarbonate transport family permease [Candidatus Obscuribacterales bacterium]